MMMKKNKTIKSTWMSSDLLKIFLVTAITLVAFAANSVLCRWALADQTIDPLSFSLIRLLSGSFTLIVILISVQTYHYIKNDSGQKSQSKPFEKLLSTSHVKAIPVVSLMVYMYGFSFAYIELGAGFGALILFVTVQFTMIAAHVLSGHSLSKTDTIGCVLSIIGLVYLLLPNSSNVPFDVTSIVLMAAAGMAWGFYTLAGKLSDQPLQSTTWNFIAASLFSVLLGAIVSLFTMVLDWAPSSLLTLTSSLTLTSKGILYAVLSGSVASGVGYTLWYYVVKKLPTVVASVSQLSVPVIATLGGAVFLSEPVTLHFIVSSTIILLGILIVLLSPKKSPNGKT
ncbi:DMT family transporter [Vibrio sp. 99-70-13A1]|uniref:DMT family transporter n=1 Tax=Vibrio sp. 99-70-13A1 TaxID=2607601 RepID=UPI0020A5C70F|nr:DMT family transporter [Vibrio sp. 99-70-13A1]